MSLAKSVPDGMVSDKLWTEGLKWPSLFFFYFLTWLPQLIIWSFFPFLFFICECIPYIFLCIIICLKVCEENEKLVFFSFLPFYPTTSLFEGVPLTVISGILLVNVSKQPLWSVEKKLHLLKSPWIFICYSVTAVLAK